MTTIKLRRGTAAAWTSANPTLLAGEEGYETDTGKRKVGNGATAWNSLAYDGGGSGVTYGTPAVVLGTAAAAGSTDEAIRRDSTIVAFDATAPTTQAIGDSAATGSAAVAARRDHKHAMPAFATPAIVLGSSAAAGSAATLVRSDGTIAAFDATAPTTQAFGDAAAVGTAAFAARRDHKHAMPANPSDASITVTDVTTNNAGTGQHGFLKKLDNSAAHFMDGQGNWSTPAGTAPGVAADTIWDATGDLAVGTGADTAAKLSLGAAGTGLYSSGTAASWALGTSVLLYDYTVAGSDKASIDTGSDTPDAGIAGTSAFVGLRNLEVYVIARTDDAGANAVGVMTLNNTATASYEIVRLTTDGSGTFTGGAAVAASNMAFPIHGSGGGASYPSSVFLTFPGYAGTTFFKTINAIMATIDQTTTNCNADQRCYGFRSTSAISRIKFAASGAAKLKVGSRLIVFAR